MMPPVTYRYIVDPEDARATLAAFLDQPVIGLDTETFWNPSTRQNQLSLLQLAAPTGEVVVVDALTTSIEQARTLIERPEAMMAAHNARFDEGVLQAAGFAVAGLVDTLRLARRALTLHSFSLASVSEHILGIPLDKTQQRSDWLRRPLSRIQLDYAALDAVIALRVFEELAARLREEGRFEAELRRAKLGPRTDPREPRESRRTRKPELQLRPLTPDERRLAETLRLWRKARADRERLPLYMIFPDKTIDHLAIERPRSLDDLAAIFGLGPARVAKFGPELLAVLQT
ncbi:MAG: HRDC domain-containing protein [Blastocatellia bacterium]|nr:HRDC domain-containing protein [Blastocatellia bacterium]